VKWLSSRSTRARLLLAFGLMFMFSAVGMLVAYLAVMSIQQSQATLFQRNFTEVTTYLELRSDLNRQRSQILAMMQTADRAEQQALERDIRGRAPNVDASLQQLSELERDVPQITARLEELRTTLAEYRQARDDQFNLIYQGKIAEAQALDLGLQQERFETIVAIATELGDAARADAQGRIAASERTAANSLRLMVIVGVMAVLLTLATFRWILQILRQMVAEVRGGVNVLGSSGSEILATTAQVAASAAQTATAVSETTTTVEEVKQTAQISSQKAKLVLERAQKAAETAQNGKQSVAESVGGMQHIREQMGAVADSIVRLSEQSQAIGDIIEVVNDLADQSNLLAVNAAIEAAKAGEQGKGFAVVAQEIRSLAEQSKQATTQVRTLLGSIQKAVSQAVLATEQGTKAVEGGTKLAGMAGEVIRELADGITEAAQSATQIAASSQQQLVGMDQVVLAMENIKQASAENASSTKQAEAVASSLRELGQQLKQLLERYQV
jgi:methyl-accepting chemotaxis protein